ncbi:inositol 2-dehydrogenase, partial [Escherichia coli]|nr:inositol 2-dehydrogenase [Escherichia coli]
MGLARGIPMFCEKPLAKDLAASISLAREVEAAGAVLQLGFQRRFDPGYVEARRMVTSGDLGTVYTVRLAGHDPAPPHEAY